MSTLAFDQRQGKIWLDGSLCDWRQANLHVLSHALHYASAVFEGLRTYGGQIFKLEEHTQRLFHSARLMDMQIPFSEDVINQACKEVLRVNNITDGYVRPLAWRGSEAMQIAALNTTIHVAICCWEWPSYFSQEAKMKGLRLKTSPWRRPSPETAPTDAKAAGLYMICTLSKHAALADEYDDALLLDYRGYIAESTGANVFFLMDDGRLHTPTPDCFLDGITRRTVIDLASKAGYEIVERHISPADLPKVKEAFLTGTAVEVTPIASIDQHNFNPGACCASLMQAYKQKVTTN